MIFIDYVHIDNKVWKGPKKADVIYEQPHTSEESVYGPTCRNSHWNARHAPCEEL